MGQTGWVWSMSGLTTFGGRAGGCIMYMNIECLVNLSSLVCFSCSESVPGLFLEGNIVKLRD